MKPIIFIDTDAGLDDIVAICMIIAADMYDIGGISVVNGVASVQQGMKNLSRILAYIHTPIPLYAGIDQKTQSSSVQFPIMDRKRANTLIPLTGLPLPNKASGFGTLPDLVKTLSTVTRPVRYLCLGPLSNMKYLLRSKKIQSNITDITIMGGAINVPGIVPPKNIAEYNFRLDPVAAQYVLNLPIAKTLVAIDATRYVPAVIKKTNDTTRPLLQTLLSICKRNANKTKLQNTMRSIIIRNKNDFMSFYDPLAAAIVLNAEIVKKMDTMNIRVSVNRNRYGAIEKTNTKRATNVPTVIDAKAFYRLMVKLVT